MQEHEVTAAGNTYKLDPPFFVMATQNPIEQEGTYPLPEAQLDRFMLSINIGYPTRSEEREIVMATTQTTRHEVKPVLQGQDILWIQHLVRQVPAASTWSITRSIWRGPPGPRSRPARSSSRTGWPGAPVRGRRRYLILGAKARAIIHGRFAVTAEDIRAMAYPVLRHRLFTNFNADAEGIDVDQIIEKILGVVPEPSLRRGSAVTSSAYRSSAGPGRPHAAGGSAHGDCRRWPRRLSLARLALRHPPRRCGRR